MALCDQTNGFFFLTYTIIDHADIVVLVDNHDVFKTYFAVTGDCVWNVLPDFIGRVNKVFPFKVSTKNVITCNILHIFLAF